MAVNFLLTTVSLDAQKGGGTAERTRLLAKYLSQAGHQCAVAAIEGGSITRELHDLKIVTYITGGIRIRFTLPLTPTIQLLRLVRNAHAVHILGYWNMLSVATAALARTVGRPYMLCAAGEFAALDKPRPIARVFHLVFGVSMIRGAAKLIAITELEKTDIVRHCGVSVEQVAVLPNGVEAVQSVTKSCSLRGEENYILFVGRLAEIKGPDLLLEAFASICDRFPKVSLVLAGPDFGLERALRARASEFGLTSRVHFKGFLPPAERSEAYRKALLLVVPSRAEAMSLVALEAGAFQKPVIVTDQCGLDAVATSCGGRVCAATSSAIAEAITELLTDPNISQLGANWHRYVVENYAWPKIVREFVNLAEDVR